MRSTQSLVIAAAFGASLVAAFPARSYDVVTVSDGGTIQGTVLYQGNVPTRKIITTKDQDVCGGIRNEPEILVDANKGVSDAVVYLVEVPKGKAWPDALPAPVLDQEHCIFKPHVQVMAPGMLTVVNSDPVLHNTHGFYGKRTAFNLALPNQGQKVETQLDRVGTVKIECDAHGWMLGWVFVVDNPYYAVTGADGKFSITDVPPGDYKLIATHEFTGPQEVTVTVQAGAPTDLSVELKK